MGGVVSRAGVAAAHMANVAWRSLHRDGQRLAVVMYHGVVERTLEPFCWHQLPLARFEEQMQFLSRTCRVLPLCEALDRLAAGTLPHRACAITFDDGFRNNLTTAYPVLRALDLPATIFLVTDLVGTQEVLWPDRLYLAVQASRVEELDASFLGLGRLPLATSRERAAGIDALLRVLKAHPADEKNKELERLLKALSCADPAPGEAFSLLTWDDVAALAKEGRISFGAHTTRHEILSRQADAQVEYEIRVSQAAVSERLGVVPRVFAYPNGRSIDFDLRAERALGEAGIPWALSTREAVARTADSPLAVPRICVGADMSLTRFRHLVGGTIDLLKHTP